jgi:hypothetical protein
VHLVTHLNELVVVQDVDLELCVQPKWVVRVLARAHRRLSQLWHETGLVVIDILVSFEQKVVEFLQRWVNYKIDLRRRCRNGLSCPFF